MFFTNQEKENIRNNLSKIRDTAYGSLLANSNDLKFPTFWDGTQYRETYNYSINKSVAYKITAIALYFLSLPVSTLIININNILIPFNIIFFSICICVLIIFIQRIIRYKLISKMTDREIAIINEKINYTIAFERNTSIKSFIPFLISIILFIIYIYFTTVIQSYFYGIK